MSSVIPTHAFLSRPGGRPSPWLALGVLCAGQTLIVIDQNIVNVALPTVQRDLGFTDASLVWVVNAYVIPFGGLLLVAGRLGDVLGRRSVFVTGIAGFSLASLLCGLATTAPMLIGLRFVQGVGGAVASAGILGMVATTFTEPGQRARAIGVYSFASAGGGALGPLLGGVLTGLVGWSWIFFVNAPIGLLLVALALRLVPRDAGRGRVRDVDLLGAVLVVTALMLAVLTLVNGEEAGWGSARTVLSGLVSLVLLAGFLARQATAADPLLPLALFRSRALTVANLVQLLLVAAMFGLLYFGTLYLQRVLGHDAVEAGLGFVPVALVIAAASLGLSARVIGRLGERTVLLAGLALVVVAFAALSQARADGTYAIDFLPAGLVMGLGFGLAAPATMGLGMAAVRPELSGIASGLVNTTQQVGGAVGLAVLSAVVSSRLHASTDPGVGEGAALADAYQAAFAVAAVLVTAALAVVTVGLRGRVDS
jgi:EmrB/QacA subfamily drug resistance transporter